MKTIRNESEEDELIGKQEERKQTFFSSLSSTLFV
jgi:hypothetical protein